MEMLHSLSLFMTNTIEATKLHRLDLRATLWWLCVLYWAAGLGAVLLRRASAAFSAVTVYGGRHVGSAVARDILLPAKGSADGGEASSAVVPAVAAAEVVAGSQSSKKKEEAERKRPVVAATASPIANDSAASCSSDKKTAPTATSNAKRNAVDTTSETRYHQQPSSSPSSSSSWFAVFLSPLQRMRMQRQAAFALFYVTGVFSSALLVLCLFLVQVGWRWEVPPSLAATFSPLLIETSSSSSSPPRLLSELLLPSPFQQDLMKQRDVWAQFGTVLPIIPTGRGPYAGGGGGGGGDQHNPSNKKKGLRQQRPQSKSPNVNEWETEASVLRLMLRLHDNADNYDDVREIDAESTSLENHSRAAPNATLNDKGGGNGDEDEEEGADGDEANSDGAGEVTQTGRLPRPSPSIVRGKPFSKTTPTMKQKGKRKGLLRPREKRSRPATTSSKSSSLPKDEPIGERRRRPFLLNTPSPSILVPLICASPLLLFLLHCCVRLWETFYIHQYRDDGTDVVTVFAMVSGCSFYAFAALSIFVGCLELLVSVVMGLLSVLQNMLVVVGRSASAGGGRPAEGGGGSSSRRFSTDGVSIQSAFPPSMLSAPPTFLQTLAAGATVLALFALVIFIFSTLHIVLQLTQVAHHYILAQLQARRRREKKRLMAAFAKKMKALSLLALQNGNEEEGTTDNSLTMKKAPSGEADKLGNSDEKRAVAKDTNDVAARANAKREAEKTTKAANSASRQRRRAAAIASSTGRSSSSSRSTDTTGAEHSANAAAAARGANKAIGNADGDASTYEVTYASSSFASTSVDERRGGADTSSSLKRRLSSFSSTTFPNQRRSSSVPSPIMRGERGDTTGGTDDRKKDFTKENKFCDTTAPTITSSKKKRTPLIKRLSLSSANDGDASSDCSGGPLGNAVAVTPVKGIGGAAVVMASSSLPAVKPNDNNESKDVQKVIANIEKGALPSSLMTAEGKGKRVGGEATAAVKEGMDSNTTAAADVFGVAVPRSLVTSPAMMPTTTLEGNQQGGEREQHASPPSPPSPPPPSLSLSLLQSPPQRIAEGDGNGNDGEARAHASPSYSSVVHRDKKSSGAGSSGGRRRRGHTIGSGTDYLSPPSSQRASLSRSGNDNQSASKNSSPSAAQKKSKAHQQEQRTLPSVSEQLEPPYTFPHGQGLFSFVLEAHYGLEVLQYVVLVAAIAVLMVLGDALAHRGVDTVITTTGGGGGRGDAHTARRHATTAAVDRTEADGGEGGGKGEDVSGPRLLSVSGPDGDGVGDGKGGVFIIRPEPLWGGDFALWVYGGDGVEALAAADSFPSPPIAPSSLSVFLRFLCDFIASNPFLSHFVANDALLCQAVVLQPMVASLLLVCRAILPTALLALFSFANLNATADEHRAFWKRLRVKVPRWNLIPFVW